MREDGDKIELAKGSENQREEIIRWKRFLKGEREVS